jgi:hypothetical protein
MKKSRWIVLGALLTALMAGAVVGAQAVYADSATPPAPPDDRGAPPAGTAGEFPGGPHGPRGMGSNELEAAAGVLGMTTDDLSAALQSGTTLEELATQKGVDVQKVHDAIKTVHQAEMLDQINQAVADGSMTQDKADWLIVGLQKGYLDGPGFGMGRGMGMGRPEARPGLMPQATPQAGN